MKLTIKKIIRTSAVLWLIPVLGVSDEIANPYTLPKDKSAEEVCLQAALKVHPGKVFAFNVYNDKNDFHYQYEINDQDKNWLVICDAKTRQVIKDELEDSNKSGL